MKTIKLFKYLFFVLLVFIFVSCVEEKPIEINIKGNDKLIVSESYQFTFDIVNNNVELNQLDFSFKNNLCSFEFKDNILLVTPNEQGEDELIVKVKDLDKSNDIASFKKSIVIGPNFDDLTILGPNKLLVGEEIILKSNYENVNWSIDNNSISIKEISSNGQECTITGENIGKSIITATIDLLDGKTKEYSYDVEVFDNTDIIITGSNKGYVDKKFILVSNIKVSWECDDNNVLLEVNDLECKIKARKSGHYKIICKYDNGLSIKEKIYEFDILPILTIDSVDAIFIDDKIILSSNYQFDDLVFEYDEEFITIEDGMITGLKTGKTTVKCYLKDDNTQMISFEIEIKEKEKVIEIVSKEIVEVGEIVEIFLYDNNNVVYDLKWTFESLEGDYYLNNNKNIDKYGNNIIIPLKPSTITIKTTYNDKDYTKQIIVNKYVADKDSDEAINFVKDKLSQMSLEEKIGQMFVTNFSGTSVPNYFIDAVNNYHFGNNILFAYNIGDLSTTKKLNEDLQKLYMDSNKIPGFISVDQEGGKIVRVTNGVTSYNGNMAIGQTGDYINSYTVGKYMGEELAYLGFTSDYAPVLDVNNNPNNPIIGVRSYSDDPFEVAMFGVNMIKGLKESGIMATSKHFPGHGNTSTDTHLALPSITSSKEDLYKIELAPFICAIKNGIDAIMTTHIIFNSIDKTNPATLSKKVLNDLLREELGYNKLILTDAMEMNAIKDNYGYAEAAILAVNASVDLITVSSLDSAIEMYNSIKNAVNNKKISIETIDNAVTRILLSKYNYGLFESKTYERPNFEENQMLSNEIARKVIDSQNISFGKLDKSKPVYFVSTSQSRFTLGASYSGNQNSLAYYAYDNLSKLGYDVSYAVVKSSIKTSESNTIINNSKNYEQIVIGIDNAASNNYTKLINLVNQIIKANPNARILVVALETPYDIDKYTLTNNVSYICTYEYTPLMVKTLLDYIK